MPAQATVPEGTADLHLGLPEGPDVRGRIGARLVRQRGAALAPRPGDTWAGDLP